MAGRLDVCEDGSAVKKGVPFADLRWTSRDSLDHVHHAKSPCAGSLCHHRCNNHVLRHAHAHYARYTPLEGTRLAPSRLRGAQTRVLRLTAPAIEERLGRMHGNSKPAMIPGWKTANKAHIKISCGVSCHLCLPVGCWSD